MVSVPKKKGSIVRKKAVAPAQKPTDASDVIGITSKSKTPAQAKVKNIVSKTRSVKVAEIKEKKGAKVAIKNNTVGPRAITTLAEKPKRTVAIPSPFRLPMVRQVSLTTFSRYVGAFFVAIGGFFALVNFQYIDAPLATNVQHQTAQLSAGLLDTSTNTLDTTTQTISVDETPDARILLSNGSVLSGDVPISIIVPLANSVYMVATNRDTNVQTKLGSATKIDSTTWKYIWKTSGFPNGEYRLTAIIVNQYGSYEHNPSDTYTVSNSVATETSTSNDSTMNETQVTSVDSTSTTTDTVVEPTPVLNNPVRLNIPESSPISDSVRFEIFVNNASEAKLYAKNTGTLIPYFLGSAIKRDNSEWRFDWNSTRVPDGEYSFIAKVVQNTVSYESVPVIKRVKNGTLVIASTTLSTDDATTAQTADSDAVLKPEISFTLSKPNPIAGFVEFRITASSADYVEAYAQPKNSLTPFFVGRAVKLNDGTWSYVWNTTQSPNGDYETFVRVKNVYGYTDSSKRGVRILNEIVPTPNASGEESIDTFISVNNELYTVKPVVMSDDSNDEIVASSTEVTKITETTAPKVVYIEPVATFVESFDADIDADTTKTIENILSDYRLKLDSKLHDYARALRAEDAEAIARVLGEIESLKATLITDLPRSVEQKEMIETINAYLSKITLELRELIEKNERIIKERIGDAVLTDSDQDDISDYDEVNLYQTNPFSADTDGDGYIDSAEIKLGYNPHDSRTEAFVTYESAKETGIVRDDVLIVESITTITQEPTEGTQRSAKALISGVALPNSFVTLYIYSTPIVVTVKTDESGSWSYLFDKELENGEHEVYIGITDNAGKIVAKSNPFSFVKTAEAFEESGPVATTAYTDLTPSFFEGRMMLLVSSLCVVALGLVLILLGVYASHKKYPPEVTAVA